MRHLSIRSRLILVLSLVLILAFVFTSLISFTVTKDHFRTSALDETLPLISNNILSEIQRDLMMPIQVSSLMANDTFLKDWALAGEKDVPQISRYLKEIKDTYGFFTAFFVSELTGRYYYYDGILKTISAQDAHDVWYFGFKERNKKFELDVDKDEASAGSLAIFINHRLSDYQGRFLGVTGVGLNMNQVGRIVSQYQAKYKRSVYLVNSGGLIMVHPDQSMIEKKTIFDLEGLSAIGLEILKSKADSLTHEFDRNGRHMFLAARYFEGFDWYLIVEQDESENIRDIRSVMFTNLGVGVLVTIFIIVIVILAVNHFQGRLEFLATVDELTGVSNRRRFLAVLKSEAGRAVRYNRPLSLLMIDVDHFKVINDSHGHQAGDRALVQLSRTIEGSLRESDLLGRLGGEEFGVVLPEQDREEAVRVAERIRAAVAALALDLETGAWPMTVSLGVATMRGQSTDIEDLLQRADQALYQAKDLGRNRVEAAG
jgi:diguanylate cyclase (GGDEF)-like protein